MKVSMNQGQMPVQSWKIQGAGSSAPADKSSVAAKGQRSSMAVGRLEKQVQRLQDRIQTVKSNTEKSDESKKAEIEGLEDQIKQLEAEIVRLQLEETKKQAEGSKDQTGQLSKAKAEDKKDAETAFMKFLVKTDITKKRIQDHKITKAKLEGQQARRAGELEADAQRGTPVETEEGKTKQTPEQEVAPMLKTIGGLEENGVSALEENIQGLYGELNKNIDQYQKEIEGTEKENGQEESSVNKPVNEKEEQNQDSKEVHSYKQKEASEKYKQNDGKSKEEQKDLGTI